MPYNGAGTFTNPFDWINEANNGSLIDPAKFKVQDDGVAAGLSNAITRDGQSTVIANIPFNNQRLTGVGDATAAQDAINRRTGDARYLQLLGGAGTVKSVSASEIDCALGNYFFKTATGALSWTFINPPAVGAFGFILELTNGGLGTQTWPASVKWPNGAAPTLTASGTDILVFITRDGGLTWRGSLSQRNSS